MGRHFPLYLRRPPIVPVFFQSSYQDADNLLLNALFQRLSESDGSPVRLAKELDTDDLSSKDSSKRLDLRDFLASQLQEPRSERNQYYMFEKLSEIFGDEKMAESFSALNSCLFLASKDFTTFDKSRYHKVLGNRIGAVSDSIYRSARLRELNYTRHAAWPSFFELAKKDRINIGRVTDLRKLLSNDRFDNEDRRSIQNIGRYCMHTSLAEMCHGETTSMSYFLYEAGKPDNFDDRLISEIRSDEYEKAEVGLGQRPKSVEVDSLEMLYSPKSLDMLNHTMDWDFIWKAFWELMANERWIRDRQILTNEIEILLDKTNGVNAEAFTAEQSDLWERLFFQLSTQLRFIHFTRNPKDAAWANIIMKAPAVVGTIGHLQ